LRPTVRDVARLAGVSHATVSRYLNRTSYVSAGAAAAIEAAVADTGYRPNRNARSLVNRRNRTVAFVVREKTDMFFADSTLSAQAVGANTTLSERDYQMLMLIVDSERSEQRIIELVAGGAADGAILLAMNDNDPIALALAESSTPIVVASTPVVAPSVPRVDTDNFAGTSEITALLRATGARPVGEIRGPAHAPVSAIRHDGFRSALGDEYDERLVVDAAEWSFTAGAAAMAELLRREPAVGGVVAASDLLAAGALETVHTAGLQVPHDVAIVGFDDSPWAARTRPPLTTVRQDPRRTGERLADLILQLIEGERLPDDYAEILPTEIVWRESAGPRPR
jgi:DNA-binding LacI/PurR family transcriptional regulator